MKTLVPLFLGLAAMSACSSPGVQEHPAERAEGTQSFSVIPLQYAVATEVANALSKLQSSARFAADERTNSVVVVCATEGDLRQLSDCIAKLDVPAKGMK